MSFEQTVKVIEQSGKIMKDSEHLLLVFKDVRDAYRKKKAEIDALRQSEDQHKPSHQLSRVWTLDDNDSASRASKNSHASKPHKAPTKAPSVAPSKSSSLSRKSKTSKKSDKLPSKAPSQIVLKYNRSQSTPEVSMKNSPDNRLSRRHTESSLPPLEKINRSLSEDKIDMDLAYGKLPLSLTTSGIRDDRRFPIRGSTFNRILDEASCLQYSITSTITNLQNDPDTLAAVVNSLVEIGESVSKMAPGALSQIKSNFPDIMALLANSQLFLSTAMDLGVKVAALGSYKMDKSIKDENERQVIEEIETRETPETEVLSVIESWRRKIAETHAESQGITPDGEYVSPNASSPSKNQTPNDDNRSQVSRKTRAKSVDGLSTTKTSKSHGISLTRAKSVKSVNTTKTSNTHKTSPSKAKSVKSVNTTKTSKTHGTSHTTKTSKTHGTSHTKAKSVKSTKTKVEA